VLDDIDDGPNHDAPENEIGHNRCYPDSNDGTESLILERPTAAAGVAETIAHGVPPQDRCKTTVAQSCDMRNPQSTTASVRHPMMRPSSSRTSSYG